MCMMVYLSSKRPLPLVPWVDAHPDFCVTDLVANEEPVRGQFTNPYVYYVGSHEGCGCGFQNGEYESFEDPDRWTAAQKSRRGLAAYLEEALTDQPEVEMFACWDGDQSAEPELRRRIRPADLLADRMDFAEKEYLIVSRAAQPS